MAKRLREEVFSAVDDAVDDDVPESRSPSTEPAAHTPKYASLAPTAAPSQISTMRCMLPPHKALSFATYDEYESHYRKDHTNRCIECRKNFPTAHFLDLHIAENHDPIVASRRDAGEKTYACFVEGCDKVCSDWKKRRSHQVDKHAYPRNYDFLVVDHGIDGRRSMLRPGVDSNGHRRSSRERERSDSSATEPSQVTQATSASESNGSNPSKKAGTVTADETGSHSSMSIASHKDGRMEDLTDSMSALKMVPRSITFGKRQGRSGFAKK